jgi:Sec-independent protein translocase protein TatA
MDFMGLSLIEMLVIVVVAVLVFGQRLPTVAGEVAAVVQKIKRQLADLRRESGIDQEIYRAKRDFEDSVRRPLKQLDVKGAVQREVAQVRQDLTSPKVAEPAAPSPLESAVPTPPAAADPSSPDRG